MAMAVAVSHTAPQVSLEELEEERKALSSLEAAQVEADVLGTHDVFHETDDLVEAGLAQMQRELDKMSPDDKEAYLEALQKCPELVETETAAIKFLRATEFDAKAAVAKLVANWELRQKIFGNERAFLPLRLTNGALTDPDVDALEIGAAQLLSTDAMGRYVVYSQCHRCPHVMRNNPITIRALFYLFHLLSEDYLAQKRGFVVIVDTRSTLHNLAFDRKLVGLFMNCLYTACPVRLRAKHVVYSDPKAVAKLFLPPYLWFCGPFVRQRARFHTGCPKELRMDLEEYGLPDINDKDAPLMPPPGVLLALQAKEDNSQRNKDTDTRV